MARSLLHGAHLERAAPQQAARPRRVVRSTKYHPDGVLDQRQHRSVQQKWIMDVMEKCFDAAHITVWVRSQRAKIIAAAERRAEVVLAAEQKHADMLAQRATLAPEAGSVALVTGVIDPHPIVQPKLELVCDESVHYAPSRPFQCKWVKPPHPMTPHGDDLRVKHAAAAAGANEERERWRRRLRMRWTRSTTTTLACVRCSPRGQMGTV